MNKKSYQFLCIFIVKLLLTSNYAIAEINSETSSAKILKPFVATYLVTAMGLEGINVTNSLSLNTNQLNQQEYHFKSYSMTIGLLAFKKDETRDEQSKGLLLNKQVQPHLYSYEQSRNNR